MQALHELDTVAYVRFASVYRSFQDIDEFMDELEDLLRERRSAADRRRAVPAKPARRRAPRRPRARAAAARRMRRALTAAARPQDVELHAARPRARRGAGSVARARTRRSARWWCAAGASSARGWHRRAGSAHAEAIALAQAGAAARGATLYLTLEPCTHRCGALR